MEPKGYLLIQRVGYLERHRPNADEICADLLDLGSPRRLSNWTPIRDAIRRGSEIKIYSEVHGERIDAVLRQGTADRGDFEISKGAFAGKGVFTEVMTRKDDQFRIFYICYSSFRNGEVLIWQVGLNSVSQPQISDE